MFTGIIECKAPIVGIQSEPPGKRLVIKQQSLAAESAIGDSIA